jgi:hypothetical protein
VLVYRAVSSPVSSRKKMADEALQREAAVERNALDSTKTGIVEVRVKALSRIAGKAKGSAARRQERASRSETTH